MLGMSKGIDWIIPNGKRKESKGCISAAQMFAYKRLPSLKEVDQSRLSEEASIRLPPFFTAAKTRSPQTMQEFTWTGPATRNPLHTYMVTNQSRADKQQPISMLITTDRAPWLIHLLEGFKKRHKISSNCCSFLKLSCPDLRFVWCITMH